MAVIRAEKKEDFTVMSNSHLRSRDMSLKAKGLLSLMLSLPDDWDYTLEGISSLVSDGISATRSALKELEAHGYLKRKPIRKDGKFLNTEYIIFERPELSDTFEKPILEKPILEKPISEKPITEKPIAENRTQLNTNILNTNLLNTKEPNTKQQKSEGREIYEEVLEGFNRICKSLPEIRSMTESRCNKIDRLLGQYTLEEILDVFIIAESNDFLKGINRGWKATFDWLISENNFVKVREGNYDRIPSVVKPPDTEYDRFMDGLKKFVEENS